MSHDPITKAPMQPHISSAHKSACRMWSDISFSKTPGAGRARCARDCHQPRGSAARHAGEGRCHVKCTSAKGPRPRESKAHQLGHPQSTSGGPTRAFACGCGCVWLC